MYKIAVIGDWDSIYGFATLGMDTFPVTDPAAAGQKIRERAESNYAVIYITEALAARLTAEINHYRQEPLPAIIQIPGTSGNTGAGIESVRKSVEQAVGADILFGKDDTTTN